MKSGFGGSSNYAKSVEVLDKNVNLANNSSINDSASGDEDILAMLTKPTNQFGLRPTANAAGTSNYKKGTGLANVAENFRGDADNVSEDEDDEPARVTYPSLYQRSAVAAQDSNSDNYYDSRRPMDSVESHIDSNRHESQDDESNESDSSDSSSREDLEIVESSSTYGKEGTDLDTPRSVDGSSLPGTVDGKMSNMNKAVDGSIINTAGQKNVIAPKAAGKPAEVVGGGGCFGCGGSSSKKKSAAAAAAAASKPAALNAAASPTAATPLIASTLPVAGVSHIDDIMSEDAAAGAMSEDNDDIDHPSTSYPKALPTVTESLAECDDEDDDDDDDDEDDDDEDDDDDDDEDLEAESVSAVDSESVAEEGTTPLSAAAVSVPSTATATAYGATAVPIASSGNDEYTTKHGYSGSASGSTGAIAATAVGATAAVGAVGAGMAYGATAVPIVESASHDEYTAKHGSSNPMSVSTPAVAATAAGATAAAGAGVAYNATAVPVAGSSNHDEYAVKYAPSNAMSSSTGAVAATAAGATAAVGAAGAGIAYGATAAPKAVFTSGTTSSGMSGDVIPPAGPAGRAAAAAAAASVPLSSASVPGGGMSAGAGSTSSIPAARVAGTPMAVPTGTGKIPDAAALAKPANAKTFCAEDDYGHEHQCCCPPDKKTAVAVGGTRGAQGGSSMGGKGGMGGKMTKPAPKPLPTKGLKYDGCAKSGFCCFVPFCVKPWQARKYKPNSLPRSSPNYRHPITGKA